MNKILELGDYDYELPKCLIAQDPMKRRSDSRVLEVFSDDSNLHKNNNTFEKEVLNEFTFSKIAEKLQQNDLLIFNNSKVIPARLSCLKETGSKVEVFVVEELTNKGVGNFLCSALIKPLKKVTYGKKLKIIGSNNFIEILGRDKNKPQQSIVKTSFPISKILDEYGEVPLPPYIKRQVKHSDSKRYQNIFAKSPGSIAAPTAGLHFDKKVFEELREKGIRWEFVTLHVGIGTFNPIKTEKIYQHKMHEEYCEISNECINAINLALKENHRIIAVGTTSLRLLESLMLKKKLGNKSVLPQKWKTNIFIKPGFKFKIVSGLITNFHLPKSTLIILLCAFLGHKTCMKAYKEAVKRKFRFFSYGDAMLAFRPQPLSSHKTLDAN